MFGAVQKDGRGIGDLAHAVIRHGEYAELVHGAETILLPPQGAVAGIVVALEKNRAVDHMLEHFWAGETAVLGHVPH